MRSKSRAQWARVEIHRAAIRADDQAVADLVRTLEESEPELAVALRALVEEYRFEQIVKLTDPENAKKNPLAP